MIRMFSLVAALVAAVAPAVADDAVRAGGGSTSGTSVFDGLIREPNVAYSGSIAYGAHPRQRLDVFEPTGDRRGPIVLFLYGGAWTSGDRATYEFVGTALAAQGLTTVVADYRLFPEVRFPTFVEDAARAYAWVDRRLARRGPERRPIFLMGHSAGAHIAALLAVDRRWIAAAALDAAPPAGLIGLAGPYAFDPTSWSSTAAIFAPAAVAPDRARPARLVDRRGPPTLLLHGALDRTVGLFNTEAFATALRARGTDVRTVVYPGIGHVGIVSAIAKPLRWRAEVLDDIADFVGRRARRVGAAPTGEPEVHGPAHGGDPKRSHERT